MEKQELLALIEKYLSGETNAIEEQALINYFCSFQKTNAWNEILHGSQEEALNNVFAKLKVVMQGSQYTVPVVRHRVHFLRTAWSRYAVAIILLFAGITCFLLNADKKKSEPLTHSSFNDNKSAPKDVAPGRKVAMLTLADGTTIALDKTVSGKLAKQGNASVIKTNEGQIVYRADGSFESSPILNSLSTPRGGEYQLTLPDSTKVWLNAASSITYPAFFTGNQRQVSITGEAYFEVAKNKEKPFIVNVAGKSTVEVLGTHFNINSYPDENSIKTTLLEGSVRVKAIDEKPNGRELILKPGDQAQISLSGRANNEMAIQLVRPDVEQVMAWQSGLFNFNKMPLVQAMRQLSRWYDVDVVYEKGIPDITFGGEMEKKLSLATVLKFLNRTSAHFRLEGRKIIVTP